jgi:hypothetical protein
MLLQFQHLLNRFRPAPSNWFEEGTSGGSEGIKLEPLPCSSYQQLVSYWKAAMEWTDYMDITLTSMLAVAASTPLQGDQVWLRVIGIPGSAKTTLCDALGTNRAYCKHLSLQTGIHSGYSDGSGKDFSLIERLNGKTAVINEGDIFVNSPNQKQLWAEWRDVYSGFTHADYRHQEAKSYEGLRMTMILAGTPKLRLMNSAALGDRFLDCVIYKYEGVVAESKLVRSVIDDTWDQSTTASNGSPTSTDRPELIAAKQRTAGYINWLRDNIEDKAKEIVKGLAPENRERLNIDFEMLGRTVAIMRTRAGLGEEEATEKELHIRLSKQLRKLGVCQAVVMNTEIDAEVMRRTAKIAYDTCFGNTFEIIKQLTGKSSDIATIATTIRRPPELVRKSMAILYQLESVKAATPSAPSGASRRGPMTYSLTPPTSALLGRMNNLLGATVA